MVLECFECFANRGFVLIAKLAPNASDVIPFGLNTAFLIHLGVFANHFYALRSISSGRSTVHCCYH